MKTNHFIRQFGERLCLWDFHTHHHPRVRSSLTNLTRRHPLWTNKRELSPSPLLSPHSLLPLLSSVVLPLRWPLTWPTFGSLFGNRCRPISGKFLHLQYRLFHKTNVHRTVPHWEEGLGVVKSLQMVRVFTRRTCSRNLFLLPTDSKCRPSHTTKFTLVLGFQSSLVLWKFTIGIGTGPLNLFKPP